MRRSLEASLFVDRSTVPIVPSRLDACNVYGGRHPIENAPLIERSKILCDWMTLKSIVRQPDAFSVTSLTPIVLISLSSFNLTSKLLCFEIHSDEFLFL